MEFIKILNKISEFKKRVPVDIELLLMALDLELEYESFPDEISGIIERKNKTYLIRINEKHPRTRQRFTIAHELGHYIYHKHLIGNGISDNLSYSVNDGRLYRMRSFEQYNNIAIGRKQETEANRFAVNILMPHEEVRKLIENKLSSDEIADKLQVSKQAMDIYLKNSFPDKFKE